MQACSRAARANVRAARPLTLTVDPEEALLDDWTIHFRHTRDGGFICLGMGGAAEFLRAIDNDPDFAKVIDDTVPSSVSIDGDPNDPYLVRLTAAIAIAKDYNSQEPRDKSGKWTNGGIAATAASAVAGARSLFGNAEILPALRQLATRLLGPAGLGPATAFLGTLFLSTNRSLVSEGTLPDAPEYSYRFDQGTGVLTVSHQHEDGTSEVLFHGRYEAGGVFRDEDGNAIGRTLDGAIALDADAIRGYEARKKSRDQSGAGAVPRAATIADTDEPRLCPDPSKDKSGYKSPGALAYQMYVGMVVNGKPLPIGLGIKMTRPGGEPVYFDDCRQSTGSLIEAKGIGYADELRKGGFLWSRVLDQMFDQADRQTAAAKGRPIEWHFAEREVADYMRPIFAKRYPGISVVYTPPPRGLIGRLKKIIEELSI